MNEPSEAQVDEYLKRMVIPPELRMEITWVAGLEDDSSPFTKLHIVISSIVVTREDPENVSDIALDRVVPLFELQNTADWQTRLRSEIYDMAKMLAAGHWASWFHVKELPKLRAVK